MCIYGSFGSLCICLVCTALFYLLNNKDHTNSFDSHKVCPIKCGGTSSTPDTATSINKAWLKTANNNGNRLPFPTLDQIIYSPSDNIFRVVIFISAPCYSPYTILMC